jgi:hypothetical protein
MLKTFFSDLWVKIKADAINALALASTTVGSIIAHIDDIATELGDPSLTQQIHSTIITDAQWFGHWMTFVGLIAIVARFKRLVQTPPKG